MAIIKNIPGLEVTVGDRHPGEDLEADGTPLEEWDPLENSMIAGNGPSPHLHAGYSTTRNERYQGHHIPIKNGHLVKYIEAKAGHYPRVIVKRAPEFQIQIPGAHIAVTVQFDNDDPDSLVKDDEDPAGWEMASDAILEGNENTGELRIRKRRFNELNIVEDSELANNPGSLGRIRVCVFYMTKRPEGEPGIEFDYKFEVRPPILQIGEKSIKRGFLSHSLGYGESLPLLEDPCDPDPGLFADWDGRPFAVFDFRYRSRDHLETLEVIPTSTASSSSPKEPTNVSKANQDKMGRSKSSSSNNPHQRCRCRRHRHRRHRKHRHRRTRLEDIPPYPGPQTQLTTQKTKKKQKSTREFPVCVEEEQEGGGGGRRKITIDLTADNNTDEEEEEEEDDD